MQVRSKLLIPLIILVVGVIAYANSFNGAFLLDDSGWILKNLQEPNVTTHITNSTRPLVGLSFFLNYQISGKNEADYHAFNLIIHLCAALLLFGIIRRTLKLPFFINTDKLIKNLLPVFSAIIWLVHPLQTESVTYIVQRAESMMGLFYLLTLYGFIRGESSLKKHSIWWFSGATLACFMGMLTKPIMVTAPLVVLLYDRTFIAGSCKNALSSRWKLYLGLSITWLILAWLVLSPNESTSTTGLSVDSATPMKYLAVQPGIILHYLKLIVWPHGLCLDYAWPPISRTLDVILPSMLLLPIAILSIYLVFKKSPLGFCMSWFFIILVPSSSVIPIADFAVEHRLYLSLAGPTIIVTASIIMLVQLLLKRIIMQTMAGWISLAILTIISATLMYQTIQRNRVYRSDEAFCRSITRISPHNFRARTMLIKALMNNNKFESAENEAHQLLIDVQKVIGSKDIKYSVSASRPTFFRPRAYMLRGMALLHLERTEEALNSLQMALTYNSNDHISHNLTAVALMGLERYQEALKSAERAIEIDPRSSSMYTLMGVILIKAGREHEAVRFLEQAIMMNSSEIIARLELAWIISTDPTPPLRDGERALAIIHEIHNLSGGGNYRTWDAMAAAYAACGDFEKAINASQNALDDLKIKEEMGTADATSSGIVNSSEKNIQERLKHYKNGTIWHRPQ